MSPWQKVAILAAGLVLWFLSQKWISSRLPPDSGGLGDRIHDWTSGWNTYLQKNPRVANFLLISSSLGIDAGAGFLFYQAVFSESLRVLFSVLVLFALRQIAQALTALPPPQGLIWRHPGFPSLLVTYGVSNDLFFSGHTALAVLTALELAHLGSPLAIGLGVFLVLYEVLAVLALRAHWTMDVMAGAFAAAMIHFGGRLL